MQLGALTPMLRDDADTTRAAGNRVLRDTARRFPWMLAAMAVSTLVRAGTALLTPAAVGSAIDAATHGDGSGPALARLAVLLAAATLAMATEDLISSYFGSGLTAWLRHRLLEQVLRLGAGGRRRFPTGEVLSRLTENAASPATLFPTLMSLIATLVTTIGAVIGLALIDPLLAITFLIVVPVLVPLVRLFISRAGDSMQRYQQLQASIATRLIDAHQGVRTIRACGTVERDIARVLEPLGALHDSGRRIWAAQRSVSWQACLLIPLSQVAVLTVGGFSLTAGSITAGDLVAASAYVAIALGVMGVLDSMIALLTCQIGAGRVGEVLDTPANVTAPTHPTPLATGWGRLELHGVCVRGDSGLVLDHIDLAVPAGSAVALVGHSGCGKSVLASLAGRLRDPDDGVVLLDDVDVSTVDLTVLRRAVSYAFERPAQLGTTVADLISYGTHARRSEVEKAAETAQAARFIALLPHGFDTPLDLAPMSGGELQRLGLARAVLRRSRLIVLDDATSSLDTATEAAVAHGLRQAQSGRTSLVIARRVATAAQADLVAWLHKGRLRALAPHRLLWSTPDYRAVFAAEQDTPGHDTDMAVRT